MENPAAPAPDHLCPECGSECVAEPEAADGVGVRFILACPAGHGAQGVLDPFAHLR